MQVKICGITNLDDALTAARLGADYVGLIRAPSARQVSLEAAGEIAAAVPAPTRPVLLFRDAPLDEIVAAVARTAVRWVQLHGDEPVSFVRKLRERCPDVHAIKAWEVTGPESADPLRHYLAAAEHAQARPDVVILDAPKGGVHPGYDALGDVSRRCRDIAGCVLCAGGLTSENVHDALAAGEYDGVDVARGVEQRAGVKDPAAVQRFITCARAFSDRR